MRRALSMTIVLACAAVVAGEAPVVYRADVAKSAIAFEFSQAGARSRGAFKSFDVTLSLPARTSASASAPTPGRLGVTIRVPSLDTQDQERDDVLKGVDLFAVAKYPQATFIATSIAAGKGPDRYVATGKLTIRGVARNVSIPFSFTTTTEQGRVVGRMKGETTIRRLDFGVGQGEWKSTEWVGNDVRVSFDLRLPAAG